jgi:hypothetical protein
MRIMAGKKRGRPAQGEVTGKSAVFSTRIRPDTRADLVEAAKASGRSLSQEIEHRLQESFRTERGTDAGSPHNTALASLVCLLAERIQEHAGKSWRENQGVCMALRAGIDTLIWALTSSSNAEPIVTIEEIDQRARSISANMAPPEQFGVSQACYLLYQLPIAKYPVSWDGKPSGVKAHPDFLTLAKIQEKLGIKRRHVEWKDYVQAPDKGTGDRK